MERVDRSQFIGASDIPVILGLVPWKTPYQLWEEKVSKREQPPSEAMIVGKYLERALTAYVAEHYRIKGEQVNYDTMICGVPVHATVDLLVEPPLKIVELKTTGIVGPRPDYSQWGPPGSSDVPLHVWTQVQAQMMVTGHIGTASVVALIGGIGIVEYDLHYEQEFMKLVADPIFNFWRHVQDGTPPEEAETYKETFQDLVKTTRKELHVNKDSELWQDLVRIAQAKHLAKLIDQYLERAKEKLRQAYPQYAKIVSPEVTISRYVTESQRVDTKLLKDRYPEIYQECLKTVSSVCERITPRQKTFVCPEPLAYLEVEEESHDNFIA